MQTVVHSGGGLNQGLAAKLFSVFLATDTAKKSYFLRNMMGVGMEPKKPIQIITELSRKSGDRLSYDISMQLRGRGTEGSQILSDNEEPLDFYTDQVWIDQMRKAVSAGDRMSQQRTLHNLRMVARARLGDWWGRLWDELFFMYLSGKLGVGFQNTGWILGTDYDGFATNPIQTPDQYHLLYARGTAKTSITAADTMSRNLIEKIHAYAKTLGGGGEQIPQLMPCMVGNKMCFVLLMHEYTSLNLKTETGTQGWVEIQKAAAGAQGTKNNLFHDALGMIGGVILHEHKNVPIYNDYGAATNVLATRSLFMGSQAGVLTFGAPDQQSGLRFFWREERKDYGDKVGIAGGAIFGIKKTRFNNLDFGVIAVDSAVTQPFDNLSIF